jgi:hypothetical protein
MLMEQGITARGPSDYLPPYIPAPSTAKQNSRDDHPADTSSSESGGRRQRSSVFRDRPAPAADEPPVPTWPLDTSSSEAPSAAGPTGAVQTMQAPVCLPAAPTTGTSNGSSLRAPSQTTVQKRNSNSQESEIKFVSNSGPELTATPNLQRPQVDQRPPSSGVRMVNNKRFSISYELKDVGPSGVSEIDLWYTSDGRNWEKAGEVRQSQSPYIVNVDHEGRFGLTMVARSGIGLGGRPPSMGDAPQIWIEVDTTKPAVALLNPKVNLSSDTHHLIINWTATDKNLAARPITLAYAEQAAGPWLPIATKIENTGRYVWQIPDLGSHRFLVRVEATDLAGNVGVAQTPEPILLDLAQPTVSILGVEPAGR